MKLTRRFKLSALAALTILIAAPFFYACRATPRIIICYGPYMTASYRTPTSTQDEYRDRFAPYFAPGFSEKQAASLPADFNPDHLERFYITQPHDSSLWGWVYVDQTGAIVLAYTGIHPGQFSAGLAPVGIRADEKSMIKDYGFMNPAGKLVIPAAYDNAQPFHQGRAVVYKNNLCAYIDTQGKLLTPFKYSLLYPYENGVSKAVIRPPNNAPQQIEYLDLQGQPIPNYKPGPEPRLESPRSKLSQGLAAMHQPHQPTQSTPQLWGYQDEHGKWVIPPQFLDAQPFSEGFAAVAIQCDPPPKYKRRNDDEPNVWASWGYIDKTGKIAIPPRFSRAHPFIHGVARVESNWYHHALIDTAGKELFTVTNPNPRPELDQYLKPAP